MLKKLVPLALVGMLAGCAAYQEALSLQGSLQTFLVRSVTLDVAGTSQCKVALIWGGTSALQSLKRGNTDVNVDKTKNFGEDSAIEGQQYTYTATFENNKSISRDIQPLTVGEAGTTEAISPDLTKGTGTALRTGLKFKWKMADTAKPTGFMVTVTDAAAPTVPLYNAFLDAASHSAGVDTYEVAYGTPSDLALLTKEISDMMGAMDPRFARKDAGVSSDQLDTAKNYLWIVSPLAIDNKAIRFAVGVSDGSPFQVTQ